MIFSMQEAQLQRIPDYICNWKKKADRNFAIDFYHWIT